jgi:predicted nucleic acid-binding protein
LIAYFDTSCFTALALRDEGWPLIADWLEQSEGPAYLSDFGWGEFVSAVGLRVRMRRLAARDGTATIALATVFRTHWLAVSIANADVALAAELVGRFELGLRLPDAIHMALASRLDYRLVTTDNVQHRAALTLGLNAVNPLALSSSEGPLTP